MHEMNIAAGLERRTEDYKLITGQGYYVDDLRPAEGRPPALYMVVVRSPYAHATIESIQLDAALSLPGVVWMPVCGEPTEGPAARTPPVHELPSDLATSKRRSGLGTAPGWWKL